MKLYPSRCRQPGQAAVEFALVIILLTFMLMGVMDLGRGVYAYNVIASAAREGARYGITHPTLADGVTVNQQGIRTHTLSTATLDLDQNQITASCSPNCEPNSNITVIVQYTFQPVTPFFGIIGMSGRSTMTIE